MTNNPFHREWKVYSTLCFDYVVSLCCGPTTSEDRPVENL